MDLTVKFDSICLNDTSPSFEECNYTTVLENGAILQNVVFKVVPILFTIIRSVAVVGNAFVVVVVAANPVLRSTTDMLIINLAAADILFAIFFIPYPETDYFMTKWLVGDWWCKVVQYFNVVAVHASIYTLVLLSLDRFLAVVYPITSISLRTTKNALIAIGCLWLLILSTAIPVGIYHGEKYILNETLLSSSCVPLEGTFSNSNFQILFFLSSYVMPFTLITIFYIYLLSQLWTSAPVGRVSAEIRRRRKKVTRMIVVAVLVFAVCWSPIQIILLLKALDTYNITYFTVLVEITAQCLAYMNSCINPVLYAFMSENFRAAFRKLTCCPQLYTKGTSGRPQRSKTTQTGNESSCHSIELKPLCNRRHIVTEQVTTV